MAKKVVTYWNYNDIAKLSNFLYGVIYYLMGHHKIALKFLSEDKDGSGDEAELSKILKTHIEAQQKYNLLPTLREKVNDSNQHLKNIFETLLGDNKGKAKNKQKCIRSLIGQIIINKKYYDEKRPNRNWFQSKQGIVIDKKEVNERVDAIVCYILRAYCSLRDTKRFINGNSESSKMGLNDLTQANSLWQDLFFYSREVGENYSFGYKDNGFTLSISPDRQMTYDSIFFVLRFLINIIRGNIYREINFFENALDHYFSGLRLCKNIIDNKISDKSNIDQYATLGDFLCPLIPLSYFEVSKLLFDKGQIVESLICQLKSIKFVLIISSLNKESVSKNKLIDIYKNIQKAIHILENLKQFSQEYIRKDMILSLFIEKGTIEEIQQEIRDKIPGGEQIKTILLSLENPLLSPKKMTDINSLINDDLRPLLADILARIGFTLFTLRLKIDETKFEKDMEFRLKEKNQKLIDSIKYYLRGFGGHESELGTYTLTILGEMENNRNFISHRIERVFCAALIEKLKEIIEPDEERLCAKLTRHTFTNVGNIASIPLRIDNFLGQDGYDKRTSKLFSQRPRLNKLVVLRRWQSFNPKVPRPKGQVIRGGGYFLFWKGKGIVIDPGYDFIQNFYEEGFSIGDINAIIITHTHPDHEDELNTIITLLAEWNQYQQKKRYIEGGEKGNSPKRIKKQNKEKYIDLFLNEGAYRKYHTWLYGKDIMIRKITLLQSSRWDRNSQRSSDMKGVNADANPVIDLKKNYNMEIEVLPSWHDELIDKHASIGFIFRLYEDQDKKPIIKIGFTGDTEYYEGIEDNFKEVDILIAHLGDIKIKELLSKLDKNNEIIHRFIEKWYGIKGVPIGKLHKKFLDYLILQDLYGVEREYIRKNVHKKTIINQFKAIREAVADNIAGNIVGDRERRKIIDKINDKFKDYCLPAEDYIYKNHLGITGIFRLFKSLLNKDNSEARNKLMIIGELPEELQSYRHILACILEELPIQGAHRGRCFTGDIGLTIGLPTKRVQYGRPSEAGGSHRKFNPDIAIRCMKCFQNNEYIYGLNKYGQVANDISETEEIYLPHYHDINQIQETSLKSCSSRISWFCQEYHGRSPIDAEQEFLITPDIRDVWG